MITAVIENLQYLFGRKDGRRPASHEDRRETTPPNVRPAAVPGDLGLQGRKKPEALRLVIPDGVESAIVAFAPAVGEMEIEGKGNVHGTSIQQLVRPIKNQFPALQNLTPLAECYIFFPQGTG